MGMIEDYNNAMDEAVRLVQEENYNIHEAVERAKEKYIKKDCRSSQQFNLTNSSICHKREKYNLDNSQLYDENTGESEDTELEDIYKFIFEEE